MTRRNDVEDDYYGLNKNPFFIVAEWVYKIIKWSIWGALLIGLCITTRCNNAVWELCQFVRICDK